MSKQNIAVLMTCYNRKDTTLRGLETLFSQKLPPGMDMEVYLVDDGSPDQTGKHVTGKYPSVHVIQGDGNLYWGGGMRLAWDVASAAADYNFYLWLNDDVELHERAIATLFEDSQYILAEFQKVALVSGCVTCPETGRTTYSGNNNGVVLQPSGVPQPCLHNNGNVVLVPGGIFREIGNISKAFCHQMGDGDYGLRCLDAGFGCYVSSKSVGTCEKNNKPSWTDPRISLVKRLALLQSPTGMLPKERFVFELRHGNLFKAVVSVVKLYASALFPRGYSLLKKSANPRSDVQLPL
jgi:GT2 family glycosyltransferase